MLWYSIVTTFATWIQLAKVSPSRLWKSAACSFMNKSTITSAWLPLTPTPPHLHSLSASLEGLVALFTVWPDGLLRVAMETTSVPVL